MKEFKAKIRLKVKNVKIDEIDFKFKDLSIESGIFSESSHYSNLGAKGLYSVLLHGTSNGRIPGRNILTSIDAYVKDNIDKYINIYLKEENEEAGHAIGTSINNYHKKTMYSFNDVPNAESTIRQKGFNNPFIWSGSLASTISYKVNNNGLFGGG